jgi:ankyrin repeat protein
MSLSASKLGNLEAVKLLIKHGAKPNIMNTFGTTALHAAAEGGHDAVIEVSTNPIHEPRSPDRLRRHTL